MRNAVPALAAAALCLISVSSAARRVTGQTVILGRPTDRSITISLLGPDDGEVFAEYGTQPGLYSGKTAVAAQRAGEPLEISITGLQPDTGYYYRFAARHATGDFVPGDEFRFHTQRAPGSAFAFGVQGDSHPERDRNMYNAGLYRLTMQNAQADGLDFCLTLGDDFNVDPLFNRGNLNADSVAQLYINQRSFLGLAARTMPLFLVNGNHEQASQYLLDGTPNSAPVLAGQARNRYYPLPAPDSFYSGDSEPAEFVGLRRDYYAWTWGDALFVTIDPYWHCPVQIDEGLGGNQGGRGDKRARDGWAITMGEAQYEWLRQTLSQSRARYKFVFSHHVLGTFRGGVEPAGLFEWGGQNRNGRDEFAQRRPGWEMPIHQLFVKYGVTIFFQGHDHLFARQEKDGVVYQETPNPADNTYTAFNREAYLSGDVLPNAGYLRVSVMPAAAKVEYIRAWLAADETAAHRNGEVAFSYTVAPRAAITRGAAK